MASGEFVALLATETLPVTPPAPDGAKVAVKLAERAGWIGARDVWCHGQPADRGAVAVDALIRLS